MQNGRRRPLDTILDDVFSPGVESTEFSNEQAIDQVMAELSRVTNPGNGGGLHLNDEHLGRSSFLEVLDISGNQLTLAEDDGLAGNSITEQSLPHMDQVGLHSMEEDESNRI